MPLVPAICPQCGGKVQVDDSNEAAVCQHCGTPFIVEKAVNNYNTVNHIHADTVNVYGNAEAEYDIRGSVLLKYNGRSSAASIPTNVTVISNSAFALCRGLTEVVIPDSVEEIGDRAFSRCEDLVSITIPKSVKKMGIGVFEGCHKLETAYIYGSCIGKCAFKGCDNLRVVEAPSLVEIGEEAFSELREFPGFEFPETLQIIGKKAFKFCHGIKKLTLPKSLKEIDDEAFSGLRIDEIFIPADVFLHGEVFSFSSLKKAIFDDNATSTGYKTFNCCSNLETLHLPQKLEYVGTEMFNISPLGGELSMKPVIFPSTVKKVASRAFKRSVVKDVTFTSLPECAAAAFGDAPKDMIFRFPEGTSAEYIASIGMYTDIRYFYIGNRKFDRHLNAFVEEHKDVSPDTNGKKDNAKKGGCYVATCVYGSYDCPEVWTLRRYRDQKLSLTWYGKAFIYIYYSVSPTFVKWFGDTRCFKNICKKILDKIVARLIEEGYKSTQYIDK